MVIATEKKLPSVLIDESTVQKISLLTPHIGSVYSGMGPDSRVLVTKVRLFLVTFPLGYFSLFRSREPVKSFVH